MNPFHNNKLAELARWGMPLVLCFGMLFTSLAQAQSLTWEQLTPQQQELSLIHI